MGDLCSRARRWPGLPAAALVPALLLGALLLAACGGEAADGGALDTGDVGRGPDVAFHRDAEPRVDAEGRDVKGRDAARETTPPDQNGGDDGPPSPECEPPAGFGCPCEDNEDCLSRFCVATPEGKACTMDCAETCPEGWTCASVAVWPDVIYQCIPTHPFLCHPCRSSTECKGPYSGEGDLCVRNSEAVGHFCGGSCGEDEDCPTGYSCTDAVVIEGGVSRQCVLSGGAECPCPTVAVGKQTTCSVSSAAGTCAGLRVCAEGGLTACDARTPAVESCNSQDDDCDGETDEDCDGDGVEQAVDNCPLVPNEGQENRDGDALGDACDPDADGDGVGNADDCDPLDRTVCTGCGEECDGKDNDCDGATDEGLCDDGIPCTVDSCDGGQACRHEPDDGACADESACTRDVCDPVVGCRHEGSTESCDDGNPCTDDSCQEGVGCVGVPRVGEPCDDSLACTAGDVCDAQGACRGTTVTCADDAGPCGARRACNGTEACAVTYPGQESTCDDGDPCTYNDRCNGAGGCGGAAVVCQNDPGTCGLRRTCNGTSTCTEDWPDVGTPCDDGESCTYSDRCDGFGICRGSQLTCENDPGVCGARRTCNGTAACAVTWPGAGTACDDGSLCTYGDHCQDGSCVGTGVVCADDPGGCGARRACNGTAECTVTYPGAGSACDDGNLCTWGDHCEGGFCVGTSVNCQNDSGECGARRTCNGTATCTVTWPGSETRCGFALPCVNQRCDGEGGCEFFSIESCDDNNPCTFDLCLLFCINDPQDGPCTDNDPGTIGDTCVNGACQPGPRCPSGFCDQTQQETCASCPADCGACPPTESNCTDYWDDDGDSRIDCDDGDCLTVPPCNGATCRQDEDVVCGSRLYSLSTAGNDVVGTASAACGGGSLGYRERAFRFYARSTRSVTFEVADGGTSDFQIYAFDDVCNPTACVATDSDVGNGAVSIGVSVTAGKTYYVVVEQSFGSDSFDFRVDCD